MKFIVGEGKEISESMKRALNLSGFSLEEDVLNASFGLFLWFLEERAKGNSIISVSEIDMLGDSDSFDFDKVGVVLPTKFEVLLGRYNVEN